MNCKHHPDDGPTIHRNGVLTLRLILGTLIDSDAYGDGEPTDGDATGIAITEIGDCRECWRAVAIVATFYAATYMREYLGDDKAIKAIEAQLLNALYAEPL